MSDDFKTFPPEPTCVTIGGEQLSLSPVRLGELPRLLALVRPMATTLGTSPDWLALLTEQGDALLAVLALLSRRERQWVEHLSLDEAIALASALFEVNSDFFVAQVAPAVQAAASQLAPRIATLTHSVGTSPSPA